MIGQQISHYRLKEKLGEGTYGVVYRGVHVHDEELQVAVKVVRAVHSWDERFVAALRQECRHLNRLHHPGIVAFRELVLGEGPTAMVLELLEGQDVAEVLRVGPMSPARAVPILRQVLEALAYAHNQGVVHRDFKPSNLFLNSQDRVNLLECKPRRCRVSPQGGSLDRLP